MGAFVDSCALGDAGVQDVSGHSPTPADRLSTLEASLRQRDFLILTDSALRVVHVAGAATEWCGAPASSNLVGARLRDFFAPAAFGRHEAADRLVMRTRMPIINQLDFSLRRNGVARWFSLTREPVTTADVPVVATLGRPLDIRPLRPSLRHFLRMMEQGDLSSGAWEALAIAAAISPARLERDAQQEFGVPAQRLITKCRLERAIGMIASGVAIGDAARACGYETQSAFAKRFREASGFSPSLFCRHLSPSRPRARQWSLE